MEIWSNESEIVVFDDSGLTFFRNGEVTEILTLAGETAYLGNRKGLRSSRRRIFSVDPVSKLALAGDLNEVPYLIDLSRRSAPQRLTFKWGSAAHLMGREYFAVLPENGKYFYRFVRLNDGGDVVSEDIPNIPQPIALNLGPLLWENKKPDVARFSGETCEAIGPCAFQRNDYGTTVSDLGSGVVLFIRPGEREVAFSCIVSLGDDDTVFACPTPQGIALSGSRRENHSCFAFVGFDGTVQAEFSKLERDLFAGAGAPFLIDATSVGVPHSTQDSALGIFDIERLTFLSHHPIPGGSSFFDHAFRVSDSRAIIASRALCVELSKNPDGIWSGKEIERKELPKKSREHQSYVSGPPSFELKASTAVWNAPVGAGAKLSFELSNSGGIGSGIEVELSGDAVAQNLISAQTLTLDSLRASFETNSEGICRAVLPEFQITAATEKGTKRSKIVPWTAPTLTIELRGNSPGSALLMVRIRTAPSVSAATGKTITIR